MATFSSLIDRNVFLVNFVMLASLTIELCEKMVIEKDESSSGQRLGQISTQIGTKFFNYISKFKNFNY